MTKFKKGEPVLIVTPMGTNEIFIVDGVQEHDPPMKNVYTVCVPHELKAVYGGLKTYTFLENSLTPFSVSCPVCKVANQKIVNGKIARHTNGKEIICYGSFVPAILKESNDDKNEARPAV